MDAFADGRVADEVDGLAEIYLWALGVTSSWYGLPEVLGSKVWFRSEQLYVAQVRQMKLATLNQIESLIFGR